MELKRPGAAKPIKHSYCLFFASFNASYCGHIKGPSATQETHDLSSIHCQLLSSSHVSILHHDLWLSNWKLQLRLSLWPQAWPLLHLRSSLQGYLLLPWTLRGLWQPQRLWRLPLWLLWTQLRIPLWRRLRTHTPLHHQRLCQ